MIVTFACIEFGVSLQKGYLIQIYQLKFVQPEWSCYNWTERDRDRILWAYFV